MVARRQILAFLLATVLPSGVMPAMGPVPAVARPARSSDAHAQKNDPGVVSRQNDPPRGKEPDPAPATTGGAMDVFADIERGWNRRNVDLILRHFGTQKVAISVEGTGPSGGTFSKNQSYYLLKDLFRYTLTRKFEFVQYRKPGDEGQQSFAIAEREYQKSDDGQLLRDKVYVSLHLEQDDKGARWVVDEIKSIR